MSNVVRLRDNDAEFWKGKCEDWRDFYVGQREKWEGKAELSFVVGFCGGCLFTFLMGLV